ncbi:MAG: ABC transporter ATP-binding protein, partial [Rhodobacteraceae bacterium]|nr:ABC transporter ATP-binding protein [Paracoccaceae bacterium]
MAKIELRKVAHNYAPDLAQDNYALSECDITWENGGRYAVLGPS